MATHISLIDVDEQAFQNPQELVSAWGSIREDIDDLGGEVIDTYAVLGTHDFVFIYETADEDDAYRIAMAIERYGLRSETLRAISIDRLAALVEDI